MTETKFTINWFRSFQFMSMKGMCMPFKSFFDIRFMPNSVILCLFRRIIVKNKVMKHNSKAQRAEFFLLVWLSFTVFYLANLSIFRCLFHVSISLYTNERYFFSLCSFFCVQHTVNVALNTNPLASMARRKSLSKQFFCVDSLNQQGERKKVA